MLFLVVAGALSLIGVLALKKSEWFACLLFFRNYLPANTGSWYTGHFWSLAIEEHFYLLWPGILVLFGTSRARWVAPLLGLGVAGWRAIDHHFNIFLRIFPTLPGRERTDLCLDGLIWGCALALFLDNKRNRELMTRWLSIPLWLGLVALLC